jgi:hypothetical protein
MTVKAVWHIVKESAKSIGVAKLARTICDGPVLGSATHREASWSRSGFDQPSMIALASSRILEPGARLWKDCRPSIPGDQRCCSS